jgi:hypothetical protein
MSGLERHHVVAERAHHQRHDRHEHHDGPVHGTELVEELGQHATAWRGGVAEELADQRDRLAGERHLPAHQQHQREPGEQEHQRGQPVLDPDHLVVLREHVAPPEALVMSLGVGDVVPVLF